MEETSVRVVLATASSDDEAEKLALSLVKEGLAACVSLLPGVRSIYRWEGKIEDNHEVMLVIKTRDVRLPELRARIEALHSYEIPEVLALPVVFGSQAYLAWVRKEATPPAAS